MIRGTDGRLIVKLTGVDLSEVDKAVLCLRQKNLTPKQIIIESVATIDVTENKLIADFPAEDTFKLKSGEAEVQAKMISGGQERLASRIGTVDVCDIIGDILEVDVSGVIENE